GWSMRASPRWSTTLAACSAARSKKGSFSSDRQRESNGRRRLRARGRWLIDRADRARDERGRAGGGERSRLGRGGRRGRAGPPRVQGPLPPHPRGLRELPQALGAGEKRL